MRKQSNAKYATFCGLAMLVTLGFTTLQRGFAQDSNACNNRLIEGTYGFTIEGQKLGGAGPVGLQVGVAMATYDGVGGFTQIDTVTVDGTVVADFTHTRATGTYTVNPDCTGTFTIDFTDGRPPVAANFVVSTDGSEIDTVVIIGKRRFPVFPVRLVPAQRTR